MVQQLPAFYQILALSFVLSWISISQGEHLIKQVASVGENLTLNCYPPKNGYVQLQWERKRGAKISEYLVNINTKARSARNSP